MTDTRPIAAYLATLVINGVPHRIRTTGRDEDDIHQHLARAAKRRTRAFYDLDGTLDEDGTPDKVVDGDGGLPPASV